MDSKRGQGLSFPVIVGAIIAILILVLVVSYTTGSLTNLFGGAKDIESVTSDTEILAAKTKCQNWCFEAKNSETVKDWKNSRYCTQKILVGTETKWCGEEPINENCLAVVRDSSGQSKKCSQDTKCQDNEEESCKKIK